MKVIIFEGTTRRGMNSKDSSSSMKMLRRGEVTFVMWYECSDCCFFLCSFEI